MRTKLIIVLVAILLMSVALSGCLPSQAKEVKAKPANFLTGIWHGWIAPISLIVGIFNKNISVYQTYNTGWWYDFGFYIAIISGFGSLSLVRRKNKKSNN
jgi:hypothetical protein